LPMVLLIISGVVIFARASGVIWPESALGIATRPLSTLPPNLGPVCTEN
jgi:hypothetical protein